jgi:hypothetical protein
LILDWLRGVSADAFCQSRVILNDPLRHPERTPFVILNLFQDNTLRLFVILKQVQDDETL